MDISRETLMEYAEKPEFHAVIDMLIDAGMLAGRWTADDLIRALERFESRCEIVAMFTVSANDDLEELVFQRHLALRNSRTTKQRKWRNKPEQLVREKKLDQRRHAKLTRTRRIARKKAFLDHLRTQRNDTKAKLKLRRSGRRQANPRLSSTVGWRWGNSANRPIA